MPRFEIDFLTEYSDEALLDELRRIALLLPVGEPLTRTLYSKYSPRVSASTISKRFGGWKGALNKAGLAHIYCGQRVSPKMRTQLARGLSNALLIAEMKRVHTLVGKEWLTTDDFNEHSIAAEDVIRRRFGSFRKGLEAAGIPTHPFNVSQFSDENCFENLAEVWTHYGRRPTYREMFELPSAIQGKTYITRWATWRKTLQAFVDWANEDVAASAGGSGCTSESTPPMLKPKPPVVCTRSVEDCREVAPRLKIKVLLRDRCRCVYCGRGPATHLNIHLHADHILAVANGGKTTLENLQTLCGKECSRFSN